MKSFAAQRNIHFIREKLLDHSPNTNLYLHEEKKQKYIDLLYTFCYKKNFNRKTSLKNKKNHKKLLRKYPASNASGANF